MPKATPIKVSFNAGELSPLMDGRTDQSKYGNGCSIVENLLAAVQGPLIRRGGFYFSGETKTSANRSWLRRFVFNVTQSYVLEFGDFYVRFFTNRGQVLEAAKVITAITQANPGQVTSNAHGFSNGDFAYISGIVGMTQLNGQTVKIAGVTANTFTLQDVDGNSLNTSAYTAYASGGTVARIYQVVTPYSVANLTDSDGNFLLAFKQTLGDVLYITHQLGTYPEYKLSRLGALNWTMAQNVYDTAPFKDSNADLTSTVYVSSIYSSAVTGAANNGAGLVRLTVGATAGLTTGNTVIVSAVTGTVEANGKWIITVVDATHIDLQNSAFVNAYVAGGVADGSTGTPVNITASAAIFNASHVGSQFYLEQNLDDTNAQWEVGKALATGVRRKSGVNNYLGLNAATTGTVKPTHTMGAVYDGDTGVRWLYTDSGFGVINLTGFTSTTVMTGTIDQEIPRGAIGTSKKTYIWAHSLISAVEGYPEIPVIFRERKGFLKGLRGALSVSGDYENFDKKIGGVITADAAIQFTLPDTNPGRWMLDGNDLLIGTGGREIAVGEITGTDPLGPGNVKARTQTSFGSRRVEPVEVGNSILFVTRSGKKLREIVYSWQSQNYQSIDLTVLSEHIAKTGISQMAYQQEPYSVIWSCTTDGQLLGFTYDREQDVLAWHRHPVGSYSSGVTGAANNGSGLVRLTVGTTAGIVTGAAIVVTGLTGTTEANGSWAATVVDATHIDLQGSVFQHNYIKGGDVKSYAVVESVCSIPSPDGKGDDLWIIARRTINGVTRRYVEWMVAPFDGTDLTIADAIYMDSALTYSGVATNTITGFFHLKGCTVDLLVNGGTATQKIVDSTGMITLDTGVLATKMQGGLPCPAKLRTMRLDAGSALGTAQGKIKRITRIVARFLKTMGGLYGANNSNLDAITYHQGGEIMDKPPMLLSGDTEALPWPGGYDTEGYVNMVWDTPTPVTVITIVTDAETNER